MSTDNQSKPEKSMTVKSRQQARIAEITTYQETTSERLPYWARSTNPIVRRHLGLYWRTIPPEIRPFATVFLVWCSIMLLAVLIPPLFGLMMLSFLASILVIPAAVIFYAYVLLIITQETARYMQSEMQNDTLQLLRTTPMSIPQILLGKVAAALWKRMDDLVMIAQLALAFSPPLLFVIYSGIWPSTDTLYTAPLMTLIGLVVVMARVILEPVMVGLIAIFIGIVVPGRSRAVSTAVVISSFYFLLLNLLSNLPFVRGQTISRSNVIPPNETLIILFDFVLPVALPLLIIFSVLKLAEYMITRD